MEKITKLEIIANQIQTDVDQFEKDISMGILDQSGIDKEMIRISNKIKVWGQLAKELINKSTKVGLLEEDHDCHASPEDGCDICNQKYNA